MATTDLRFDVSALDRASQTFTRLGKAVERFEKRLDDLDGKRVAAEVDVDTKKADRAVGAFATNLQKRIAAAAASLPEIQLTADSSDADRKVARIQKELAALADQRVGVDIDARSAQAEVARLEAELRSLGDVELDIEMRANVGAAMAQLAAVNGEIDRLDGRRVEVKFDVDRSLADGVVRIAAFGRALGTLALPAAAVAAAPQLASSKVETPRRRARPQRVSTSLDTNGF